MTSRNTASLAASDKVHCYGVHSCKGNSDGKTAEHACKGLNACKGHGFKPLRMLELSHGDARGGPVHRFGGWA